MIRPMVNADRVAVLALVNAQLASPDFDLYAPLPPVDGQWLSRMDIALVDDDGGIKGAALGKSRPTFMRPHMEMVHISAPNQPRFWVLGRAIFKEALARGLSWVTFVVWVGNQRSIELAKRPMLEAKVIGRDPVTGAEHYRRFWYELPGALARFP